MFNFTNFQQGIFKILKNCQRNIISKHLSLFSFFFLFLLMPSPAKMYFLKVDMWTENMHSGHYKQPTNSLKI